MDKSILLLLLFTVFSTCRGAGGSIGGGSSDSHETEIDESNIADDLKIIYEGRTFTLSCKHLNFSSGFRWYKDESELIEIKDKYNISTAASTLKVLNADSADVATYKCEAKKDHTKTEEFRTYMLNLKRLPKSTTVQEGDKLSLVCEVSGEPKPTVRWIRDDLPILKSVNDTSRVKLSNNSKDTENATLTLENLSIADYGKYTCQVFVYGMNLVRDTTTTVRVKSIYAALWPFLGIVAEVVVLCVVIFIYERKRMKNEYEESDTDQGPDQ